MDKMVNQSLFNDFYKDRKVLITGHTGFKGSWLSILLTWLGAEVYGYSLKPPTNPSLYELANIDKLVSSTIGDIRDYSFLQKTLRRIQPEVVIHMAAQPLVLESYRNPRETYDINVMGTVNVLEAARHINSIKVILNITTDKCYENKEWHWGYRENDPMGGYDPYSNSKACSELVTSSFRNAFFNSSDKDKHSASLATARAGNVIGGGDWSQDRLIPDFFRSVAEGKKVLIRNPKSCRPWQHVLEPLTGYLMLCEKLFIDGTRFSGGWNFGPDDSDIQNVHWIITRMCDLWGNGAEYEIESLRQPHEACYLKLDCSKAKSLLGWYPKWSLDQTLIKIVEWNKSLTDRNDMRQICMSQIEQYFHN